MNHNLVGGIFLGAMGMAVVISVLLFMYQAGTRDWNLKQGYFPCAEDNYLGFSEKSKTHVVCLSLEEVYGIAEKEMR